MKLKALLAVLLLSTLLFSCENKSEIPDVIIPPPPPPPPITGTYYVDPSGSNSNDGSIDSPFATLAYACAQVTTVGNIIHLNAGTFNETVESELHEGVSIEGEGNTSIVKSSVDGNTSTLSLYSGSESITPQHISNVKFDGNNLTAYRAIYVGKRSNVEINNCTFINFNYYGISFYGGGTGEDQPTTWSYGNKVHDCIITNCSAWVGAKNGGEGKGSITIDGTEACEIYNNTITQKGRSGYMNGYLIKCVGGWNKGLKIYNNIMDKEPVTTSNEDLVYDFAIEIWQGLGGLEIYNNQITGGSIDLSGDGGNTKGTYEFAAWIHHNSIGSQSLSNSDNPVGILFEVGCQDIIVEYNHIYNVSEGIWMPIYDNIVTKTNHYDIKNMTIRYNIFDNMKTSGIDCLNTTTSSTSTYDGFYVYNNVIVAAPGYTTWGIKLPYVQILSNVYIRNNIITNFGTTPIRAFGDGMTVNNMYITNNIFFNNGNSNDPYFSITPTQYTYSSNIKTDPKFISSTNFHLQSVSPAINAGYNVGLTLDYDKHHISNPPEIGVYEY